MTYWNLKQGFCAVTLAASFALAGPALAEKPVSGDQDKPAKKMKAERGDKGDKADRGAKGERAGNGELRGPLAEMKDVVGLTDDQVQQIIAIGKQHHEARKAWMQEHGEKMKQLREKYKAAEGDEKAKVRDEMKALTEEIRNAEEGHRQQVMGVLTPDQAQTWVSYQLHSQLERKTSKFDLTPSQQSQVKAIATDVAASKGLGAGSNYSELREAVHAGWQRVAAEVLTEDQKSQMGRGDKGKAKGQDHAKHKHGDKPMKAKKDKAQKTDKE